MKDSNTTYFLLAMWRSAINGRSEHTSAQRRTLAVGLFLLPLLLALWWGSHLANAAYPTLRYAHNLAMGRGLAYDMTLGTTPMPLLSPLQTAVLTPLSWLGLPLETAIFVLSTLGWAAATVLLFRFGQNQVNLKAGLIAAILFGLSPLFTTTVGLATGWFLVWLLLSQQEGERSFLASIAPTLLLLTHFDAATAVLALLLWLGKRPTQPNKQNWFLSGLTILLIALAWAAWVSSQMGTSFFLDTLVTLAPGQLPTTLQQLWRESELYWLFVPPLLIGLVKIGRQTSQQTMLITISWVLWAGLVGSKTVGWITAVIALLLIGSGTAFLIQYLVTQASLPVKSRPKIRNSLTLLSSIILLLPQLFSISQRADLQPTTQTATDPQIANWLQQNSPPTATVWAAPRLAFLADRPRLIQLSLPNSAADLPNLLNQLETTPPRYIIMAANMNWDFLTRTGWFQERYLPASPIEASTVVWAYQDSLFDEGVKRPLSIQTEQGIALLSAQVTPQRIQPGDQVFITLQLQATRPISNTFQTIVRAIAPLDGVGFGQQVDIRPQSRPLDWWEPGQTISERIVLTTTQDIPVGVYEINVSLLSESETIFWPLFDGENEMEAVELGTTAVPWQGEITAPPVDATFGDQIKLTAATISGSLAAGEIIEVELYWETLRPPVAGYTVFVHLVNSDNERVTGHDGQPHNGRFPTSHWLTGETLADTHSLAFPADLPDGVYQIKVGLYLLETGERLPVWDNAGVEQPERSITLPPLEFR